MFLENVECGPRTMVPGDPLDTENRLGAMLSTVQADGPADRAGLMSHDLVVRLDGEPVTGIDDMIRLLDRNRIGKTVKIEVLRLGRLREFEVVPSERPVPAAA